MFHANSVRQMLQLPETQEKIFFNISFHKAQEKFSCALVLNSLRLKKNTFSIFLRLKKNTLGSSIEFPKHSLEIFGQLFDFPTTNSVGHLFEIPNTNMVEHMFEHLKTQAKTAGLLFLLFQVSN